MSLTEAIAQVIEAGFIVTTQEDVFYRGPGTFIAKYPSNDYPYRVWTYGEPSTIGCANYISTRAIEIFLEWSHYLPQDSPGV